MKDGFHQFDVHEMAPWFALADPASAAEHGTITVWDEGLNCFRDADPAETVWPCVATMSMGWSWALYFCQAAVEFAVLNAAGVGRDRAVRERHPAPRFSSLQPVTCTYVDNVGLTEARGAESVFGAVVESFNKKGIQVHEVMEGLVEWPHLGALFDGKRKVLKHKPERVWRVYLAGKATMRKKRLSGTLLRVWVGHAVHLFTLARPALTSLVVCYKFVTAADGTRLEVWPSLRREIRAVCGLLFLTQVQLGMPVAPIAYCSDSSDFGYCLSVSQVETFKAAAEMRHRERWRFRVVRQDDRLELTPFRRSVRRRGAHAVAGLRGGGRLWRRRAPPLVGAAPQDTTRGVAHRATWRPAKRRARAAGTWWRTWRTARCPRSRSGSRSRADGRRYTSAGGAALAST